MPRKNSSKHHPAPVDPAPAVPATADPAPPAKTFPAPHDGYRARGKTYRAGQPVPVRYGRVVAPGEVSHDPANGIADAPPNLGRSLIPQILTFGSRWSGVSNVYRSPDQALRESLENARFMRNDPSIMECLEARQRAVALLPWSIEAEEKDNPQQKELADQLTDIVGRTAQFTEYRRNLLEATWYGRYAVQHQFGWEVIKGKRRSVVQAWQPINGDKLAFRYDDGSGRYLNGQVGIRVYAGGNIPDAIAGARQSEPTADQGNAYFLEPWERGLLAIHRHIIEDGAFEDPLSAGRIHGVGIRDRIYWCWFQKQESMATLMEVIQRTGTGFTIYYYEQGNPKSEAAMKALAEQQTFSNILLMPRTAGDPHSGNGVERIEPNSAGINILQEIIHNFFEWQIKRYIMGQTLTSEAGGTGMGSGVAQAHQDTFYQIVKYDAVKLEETLTTDLVEPLRNYNLPHARNFKFFFRIKVDDPASDRILQSAKTAWEMGAKLPAKAILDICGLPAAKLDEETLCKQPQTPNAGSDAPPAKTAEGHTQPPPASPPLDDPTNDDVASHPKVAKRNHEPVSNSDVQPQISKPEAVDQYEKRTRYQNPDQPRVPAGSPQGGQFTKEGNSDEPSGGSTPDNPSDDRNRTKPFHNPIDDYIASGGQSDEPAPKIHNTENDPKTHQIIPAFHHSEKDLRAGGMPQVAIDLLKKQGFEHRTPEELKRMLGVSHLNVALATPRDAKTGAPVIDPTTNKPLVVGVLHDEKNNKIWYVLSDELKDKKDFRVENRDGKNVVVPYPVTASSRFFSDLNDIVKEKEQNNSVTTLAPLLIGPLAGTGVGSASRMARPPRPKVGAPSSSPKGPQKSEGKPDKPTSPPTAKDAPAKPSPEAKSTPKPEAEPQPATAKPPKASAAKPSAEQNAPANNASSKPTSETGTKTGGGPGKEEPVAAQKPGQSAGQKETGPTAKQVTSGSNKGESPTKSPATEAPESNAPPATSNSAKTESSKSPRPTDEADAKLKVSEESKPGATNVDGKQSPSRQPSTPKSESELETAGAGTGRSDSKRVGQINNSDRNSSGGNPPKSDSSQNSPDSENVSPGKSSAPKTNSPEPKPTPETQKHQAPDAKPSSRPNTNRPRTGKKIGEGAEGTVHENLDDPSKVVKIFHPGGTSPRQAMNEFENLEKARALHPNNVVTAERPADPRQGYIVKQKVLTSDLPVDEKQYAQLIKDFSGSVHDAGGNLRWGTTADNPQARWILIE